MICYLSLGTNLGNRTENLDRCVELLENQVGTVLRKSNYHQTEPVGFESDNMFLNACVCVDTALGLKELLYATQDIERQMGRTKKSVGQQYCARLIDVDILLYGDKTFKDNELEVPHPRMKEREFVMKPLLEILTNV